MNGHKTQCEIGRTSGENGNGKCRIKGLQSANRILHHLQSFIRNLFETTSDKQQFETSTDRREKRAKIEQQK